MKKSSHHQQAEAFCQHAFSKRVEFIGGLPDILITPSALNMMWHYVDAAPDEVSWLGTCVRRGKDLLIQEVFLLDQQVGPASTVITEDGLSKFAMELTEKREDGRRVWNSLRFWGHSHVRMGTSPSTQDDDLMDYFRTLGHKFFVRGILNKNGRMEFTVDLYDKGLRIFDAPWRIHNPADFSVRSRITAEMRAKVHPLPPVRVIRHGGRGKRVSATTVSAPSVTILPSSVAELIAASEQGACSGGYVRVFGEDEGEEL